MLLIKLQSNNTSLSPPFSFSLFCLIFCSHRIIFVIVFQHCFLLDSIASSLFENITDTGARCLVYFLLILVEIIDVLVLIALEFQVKLGEEIICAG